ncbi:hypothetical protein CEXT_64521 [Caerostris extrusa]|uniref:Uncharacterized protein n=1 Tax=Caerostris extrusa TaxID=172846 RepID=A0AAV4R585_CAEEX|nr:hypothetical protein CEXT_64521 [Caerostris extrusa]
MSHLVKLGLNKENNFELFRKWRNGNLKLQNSKHTRLKLTLSQGRKATSSSPRVDLLRRGLLRRGPFCVPPPPARKMETQKNNSDAIRRRCASACGRRDFLMRFEGKVGKIG